MTDHLGIEGLAWEEMPRIDNGQGSFVYPIPTTHLVHIVFHGESPFAHGQYGVHLGLEDRLTFLGPPEAIGTGHFIDCRRNSPTRQVQFDLAIHPDPARRLRIPCGVGHCFDGLEGIYTINSFNAYLPPPAQLLTSESPWATGADIFNFPMDVDAQDLPIFDTNPYPASERFYELLNDMQAASLHTVNHEYPVTNEVLFADGTRATLMVRKPLSSGQRLPEWEGIGGIEGLGWRKHHTVWSSEVAGYSALTDYAPLQLIEHGSEPYSTDAYGIHLKWEDRLTFLGPSDHEVTMHFVDFRADSATLHREATHSFQPSAIRCLVIPAGVGHALNSMESVFTLNRPRRCAGAEDDFEPGNDVIDWPLSRRPWPVFRVEHREFSYPYYQKLAGMQQAYLSQPRSSSLSTAAVLMVDDGSGNSVRVALRKAL